MFFLFSSFDTTIENITKKKEKEIKTEQNQNRFIASFFIILIKYKLSFFLSVHRFSRIFYTYFGFLFFKFLLYIRYPHNELSDLCQRNETNFVDFLSFNL